MALDREAFIDNYCDELDENIENIDSTVVDLKTDPENRDYLKYLLRLLHSVKGSSRMLGFKNMEAVTHGLESVFKGIDENRYPLTADIIDLVFLTTDYLRQGSGIIREDKTDNIETDRLLAVFQLAESNEPFSIDEIRIILTGENADDESSYSSRGVRASERDSETIRVKLGKIDKIIRMINGLIIRQFQFKRENDLLAELETSFSDLLNLKNRDTANEKFNEQAALSMKHITKLRKNFLEEFPMLERGIFEIQDEVLSLRMLPLQLILAPLKKMTAEMSIHIDKEVNLEMTGAGILLDKAILEHINDPVLHIVRNAVDHGIETQKERHKNGKTPAGTISIKCATEGGNISIKISDDGRGIDYEKLRTMAIERHPERKEEILSMPEESLNTFLFQSGFSTKKDVSDISGRGVGLDIVKTGVESIKGKVSLKSEEGTGTEFILSLPLSLSTTEGFFVEAAGKKFLIPSNFVSEVLIIEENEIMDLISRKAAKWRERIIPIYSLAAVLNIGTAVYRSKNFVVILESLGETSALLVDSVLRFSTLVHKPLPSNLSRLKALQGIVFDESFNIVTILHVPELMQRFRRIKNIDDRKKYSGDEKEYKRVLIVDDSHPTREIEKSILEFEDYSVSTAVDGIDALEKSEEQYYHLIITDIQMPRMDGITLIDNLRKKDKYAKTPVIVVTSTDDNSVREKFRKLNVDSFVMKSDFDRGVFLEEVQNLIG